MSAEVDTDAPAVAAEPRRVADVPTAGPSVPTGPPFGAPAVGDGATPVTRRDRVRASTQRVGSVVQQRVTPTIRRGPFRVARQTVASAWNDRILGLSAEAAFWQLLSIPPLILGVLGSLGYFGGFLGAGTLNSIERQILDVASNAFTPQVIDQLIAPSLDEVLRQGRLEVVSLGFLISLWAGSSAMATFVNTITIAYGQRHDRGAVRSRLLALRLYVIFVLLLVVSLPLLVIGPRVLREAFPADLQGRVQVLINAVYWPILLLLLILTLTSLYRSVLPRRPRWHRQLPGAVLAVAIFTLGGLVVREYITFVLERALSYGALASPIAALIFLFLIGLALIFGAELNATLERRWPARPSRAERRRLAREALHAERHGVPLLVL